MGNNDRRQRNSDHDDDSNHNDGSNNRGRHTTGPRAGRHAWLGIVSLALVGLALSAGARVAWRWWLHTPTPTGPGQTVTNNRMGVTVPALPVNLPQQPPLVSVIVPTSMSREHFHERLYGCFAAQRYPNKEMVVLESGGVSPFFAALEDPRVRFVAHKGGGDLSTGRKRNSLVRSARGDIIAHFDDDDYYGPEYLNVMVSHLLQTHSDFTTLSGFFMYSPGADFVGYWDKTKDSTVVPGARFTMLMTRDTGLVGVKSGMVFPPQDSSLFGYGFSYVYTKQLFNQTKGFPDKHAEEDFAFVQSAQAKGLKTSHLHDKWGIALKLFHRRCSSNLVTQFRLPTFVARELFGSAVERFLVPGAGQ